MLSQYTIKSNKCGGIKMIRNSIVADRKNSVRRIATLLIIIAVSMGCLSGCSKKSGEGSSATETTSADGVVLSDDSSDFVLISDVVPDAILEIRYYSTYNFVGDRIDGYE